MTTAPFLFTAMWLLLTGAPDAQHPAMPQGMTHEDYLAQMQKDADLKRRGAAVMGFDQDRTTHHFRLTPTGGAIEVTVNDPHDDALRQEIREHLKTITDDFRA